MQRQSLGSPPSEQIPSEKWEEEMKKLKPRNDSPEYYIHLIPILTLLCFVVLFLSSHKPSEQDLAEFKAISISISASNVSVTHMKKGNILSGVENSKKLEAVDAAKERLLHRKIVGF